MKDKFKKSESLDNSPFGKQYSKMVFFDEEKRKEWEESDPAVKKDVLNLLKAKADAMETKISIEILANTIIDLQERIEKLEKGS